MGLVMGSPGRLATPRPSTGYVPRGFQKGGGAGASGTPLPMDHQVPRDLPASIAG